MAGLKVVLISVLLASVVACEGTIEFGEGSEYQHVASVGEGATPGKADNSARPDDGLDGAALFLQHCAACHGADATGGASYPASILEFQPIAPILANGQGAMPPVPLDEPEVLAIQSFLVDGRATSQPSPPDDPPVDDGTSPALRKYTENCAVCHGSEGEGTPSGPQIRMRDPGLATFTVRQGRNGPGNPTVMPVYSKDEIADDELDEMITWLDSMPNPTDGEGLYNRYCANCHGVDGRGGPSFQPLLGRFRIGSIARDGHGAGRYADRTEYMPGWTEEQLSDDEIALIEGYMRTL